MAGTSASVATRRGSGWFEDEEVGFWMGDMTMEIYRGGLGVSSWSAARAEIQ